MSFRGEKEKEKEKEKGREREREKKRRERKGEKEERERGERECSIIMRLRGLSFVLFSFPGQRESPDSDGNGLS